MKMRTVCSGSLLGLLLSTGNASAAPLLDNGDFEQGALGWEVPGFWAGGAGTTTVEAGRLCTTVTAEGTDDWGAQLRQTGRATFGGAPYRVRFRAWSSVPLSLPFGVIDEPGGFVDVLSSSVDVDAPLDGPGQEVAFDTTASADTSTGNFRFLFGGGIVPAGETLCLDDVQLEGPLNLVDNDDFSDQTALGWESGFWGGAAASSIDNERLCTHIDSLGEETWMVQQRVNDIPLRAGRPYTLSADIWSSEPASVNVVVIDEADDYKTYFNAVTDVDAPLAGTPTRFVGSFTSDQDTDTVKYSFHMGGGLVPAGATVCLDNVRLLDPLAEPEPEEPPPPPLHINQVGYLPQLGKRASYAVPEGAADPAAPRPWALLLGDQIAARGNTLPFGSDAASGDYVHFIDFSEVTTEGSYTLLVSEAGEPIESFPFEISASIYESLVQDSLAYFYHNRSGTPILAEVVGEPWARPAAHLSDESVPLYSCEEEPCAPVNGVGGWYDAGDHGKYVVNGGISVWTLMHQYERSSVLGGNAARFGDGTLDLPQAERENGVPDLLDEARWEMEWLLRMQIPAGQPGAGLAYHKLHDAAWTALPTAPHEDTQPRFVHPPSTAATLNVAASAAQCARVFAEWDAELAERCLEAARLGFQAALDNPTLLASGEATGGGGYTDQNVSDELYWAATELYLTTGEEQYAQAMAESELHLSVPTPTAEGDDLAVMTWQSTRGLGLISLAAVGERYGAHPDWVDSARSGLLGVADTYAEWIGAGGYPAALPIAGYYWGSNSFVLNNLLVLGLARDFSCDERYATALHEGATYLFGRNPLGHSYVTGYGERPERYPHHRFWAEVLDPAYPPAPPGAVAGGPNLALQDPVARWLEGCAPQRCFLDDINAWSVNEITINWNAPLAAVASYLQELGDPAARSLSAQRCQLRNYPFLSFEDPERAWTLREGPAEIAVVEGGSHREHALSVSGAGYSVVQSPVFQTTELLALGSELAIDVWLPSEQSNPWWLGDVSVFFHSPEAGLFNHYAGRADLTGQPLAEWTTLRMALPGEVQQALLSDVAVELRIAINTNNGQAALLLDNVRFQGEPPTEEATTTAPPDATEASAGPACFRPKRFESHGPRRHHTAQQHIGRLLRLPHGVERMRERTKRHHAKHHHLEHKRSKGPRKQHRR